MGKGGWEVSNERALLKGRCLLVCEKWGSWVWSGTTFIIVSNAFFKMCSRRELYPHSRARTGFPMTFLAIS